LAGQAHDQRVDLEDVMYQDRQILVTLLADMHADPSRSDDPPSVTSVD